MDDKTIEAMRAVIGCLDMRAAIAYRGNHEYVSIGNSDVPIATFRAAVEGLRTLVDEAAERAEGVTVKDASDGERLLDDLLYALEQVTREAEKNGDTHVQFKAKNYSYAMYTHNARATILAIEAMTAARPAPSEPRWPAEPTIEECVAAINRAKHRGSRGWVVKAKHTDSESAFELDCDEIKGLGRLLIERERADAAKGGA